ncbi:MAG: hypothetical protein ACKOWF_10185 [Chloroflexota bacterium]
MAIIGETRRLVAGLAAAGLLTVAIAGAASAQAETSGVGNGGNSNANSDGGSIDLGPIGTGSNEGVDVGAAVETAMGVDHDDLAASIIAQIMGS